MKKLFFLMPFFVLFSNWLNAQGDYFAPIGAEWHYGALSPYNYPHYSIYRAEKDTIVAGVNCRKITGTYVPKDSAARQLDDMYVYSTPDTVFYYNHTFKRFTPLYIFNLEVGDTVSYYIPYFAYLPHYRYQLPSPPKDSILSFAVIKKEEVNVDGVMLRVITTASPYGGWRYDPYTERIGSPILMIPHNPGAHIPELIEVRLRCYKDQEISHQLVMPCDTIPSLSNGVVDATRLRDRISVYPNPSNGIFNIRIGSSYPYQGRMDICDLTGKLVQQLLIPKEDKNLHQHTLSLPAGMYIIKYSIDNRNYSSKLLISP